MRPNGVYVYFALLALLTALRVVYTLGNRPPKGERRFGLTGLLLTLLPFTGMIVLPVVYAATDWLASFDYTLGRWAVPVGSVLMLGAAWLLWRSHADLASNWSPGAEPRESADLVTTGVYARLRHPMYASHLLWGLAQPLLVWNLAAGFSNIVLTLPLVLCRLGREERSLIERYGGEYLDYQGRSGALLPRLFTWRQGALRTSVRGMTRFYLLRPIADSLRTTLRDGFAAVSRPFRRLFGRKLHRPNNAVDPVDSDA